MLWIQNCLVLETGVGLYLREFFLQKIYSVFMICLVRNPTHVYCALHRHTNEPEGLINESTGNRAGKHTLIVERFDLQKYHVVWMWDSTYQTTLQQLDFDCCLSAYMLPVHTFIYFFRYQRYSELQGSYETVSFIIIVLTSVVMRHNVCFISINNLIEVGLGKTISVLKTFVSS